MRCTHLIPAMPDKIGICNRQALIYQALLSTSVKSLADYSACQMFQLKQGFLDRLLAILRKVCIVHVLAHSEYTATEQMTMTPCSNSGLEYNLKHEVRMQAFF